MAIDPDVPLTSRNQINSTNGLYSEFLQWLVVNIPEEDIQKGIAQQPLPLHFSPRIDFFFPFFPTLYMDQ